MKRACQELWFELIAVGLQTQHTEAGQDSPSHHVPWQPWGDGHMQPFLGTCWVWENGPDKSLELKMRLHNPHWTRGMYRLWGPRGGLPIQLGVFRGGISAERTLLC